MREVDSPKAKTEGEIIQYFYYPSVKNQRFLPPPLTRGGFIGAARDGKIN